MQNIRKMGALLGASAVFLTLAGCGGNTEEAPPAGGGTSSTSSDRNSGSDVANAAANNLGTTANSAVNAAAGVGNAVAGAGQTVANGAANVAAGVGKAVDGATLTPQIKTAFAGNKGLNGSKIDVDTNQATKTVTLTGTVTSPAMKTLAGSLAQQKASGYKVTNSLTVAGKK